MTQDTFSKRIARPDDLPELLILQERAFIELCDGFYPKSLVQKFLHELEIVTPELLAEGHYHLFLERDGRIAASGGWSQQKPAYANGLQGLDAPNDAQEAIVRAMFVRPDLARRGLGRKMMTQIETDAFAHGVTYLTLDATRMGEPLYRACGFQEIEPLSFALSGGITIQGVTMEKWLVPNASTSNSRGVAGTAA